MAATEIIQSRIATTIGQARRAVFGMPFGRFYVLVLVLCVVQNGLWYSPLANDYLLMSKDIFKNPFLGQWVMEWILSSFLGPALAYFTSMNRSLLTYCGLQLAIFLVGFTTLILVVRHRKGDFIARSVLIVFFLSPLPNILFTWLGTPDILTALLSMAIVVFWENPWVLLMSSLLLGINHPEQGTVILVLLTLFSLLTRPVRETLRFAVMGLGGLAVGAALLQSYLSGHNFDVVYTRVDYVMGIGLPTFIKATLSEPFALLFSLYNAAIMFIAAHLAYHRGKGRIGAAFILYSVLAFLSILFTLDQTRVFAILTFPALLMLVLAPSYQRLEGQDREFFETVLIVSVMGGILIPRFVVWNGSVSASAYAQIIAFLQGHGTPPYP